MSRILHVISYPCWKRFLQAVEGPSELTQEDLESAEYKLLTETGIARIEAVRLFGESRKTYNLFLTDTAKQIFETYDLERLKQDKQKNYVVHLVAVAAVNAYGVIGVGSFIDLFNRYTTELAENKEIAGWIYSFILTPDVLESILAPYTELRIDALLVDGYLVNRMLYNDDPNDIPRFHLSILADNYYPFSLKNLLQYANVEYYESTSQIAAFLGIMEGRFPEMTEGDMSLLSLLFSPSYLSEWPQLIEEQLCPMLKTLPREKQEEFAEMFVAAIRSARSWRFRGFPEDEIFLGGEKREEEVKEFMRVLDKC